MKKIRVSAAVIERNGTILLCQRPPAASHLPNFWEFPGGKIEGKETPQQALKRELKEELDVIGVIGDTILQTTYKYPEKTIELFFFSSTLMEGAPKGLYHQKIKWVPIHQLSRYLLPPADRPLIKILQDKDKSH